MVGVYEARNKKSSKIKYCALGSHVTMLDSWTFPFKPSAKTERQQLRILPRKTRSTHSWRGRIWMEKQGKEATGKGTRPINWWRILADRDLAPWSDPFLWSTVQGTPTEAGACAEHRYCCMLLEYGFNSGGSYRRFQLCMPCGQVTLGSREGVVGSQKVYVCSRW